MRRFIYLYMNIILSLLHIYILHCISFHSDLFQYSMLFNIFVQMFPDRLLLIICVLCIILMLGMYSRYCNNNRELRIYWSNFSKLGKGGRDIGSEYISGQGVNKFMPVTPKGHCCWFLALRSLILLTKPSPLTQLNYFWHRGANFWEVRHFFKFLLHYQNKANLENPKTFMLKFWDWNDWHHEVYVTMWVLFNRMG